ncbi:MAG: DUF502 domain-containing protein [Alphaproteobacteria bacterium]|nr:DUF502 domain-containing protein [Alphaproteobacteria bacterium]
MAELDDARRWRFFAWLRNSFLAGVALVLPFVITVWLVWTFVSFIDQQVWPILPASLQPFAENAPGVGLAIALVALTLIGALAGNLFGRFLLRESERIIANLPIVRSIYGGSKQIFKQVAAPDRTSFKEPVLVEFPHAGKWAIGFITNEEPREVTAPIAVRIGEAPVAVYVPLAPFPTSGFLLYMPREQTIALPITTEEALQRIFSFGIVRTDEPTGPSRS